MEAKLLVSQEVNNLQVQDTFMIREEVYASKIFHQKNLVVLCDNFFPLFCQNKDCKELADYYSYISRVKPGLYTCYDETIPVDTYKGTYLIISHVYFDNYGHFTVQAFSNLLLAYKFGIFNNKVTVVTPKLNKFQKQLFDLFFEKYCQFEHIEIQKSKRIALFEDALYTNSTFTFNINDVIINLFSDFSSKISNKFAGIHNIYISRKDAGRRSIVNEDEIISFFKKKNFRIFEGAKLSLREQISLFSPANIIAGAHGAGGANLIYSQRPTHFIEFFSENWIKDFHARISLQKSCSYSAIVNPSSQPYRSGTLTSIIVNLNLVEKALCTPVCDFQAYVNKKTYIEGIIDNSSDFYLENENGIYDFIRKFYLTIGIPEKHMSYIYEKCNKYDIALDYAVRYIQKEEKNLQAYINASNIYCKKFLFDSAKEILKKADTFFQNSHTIAFQLSSICNHQNDLESAITYANKALEISPFNFDYKVHLAKLLRKKGDSSLAINLMKKAIGSDSYSGEAYLHLSYIFEDIYDFENALSYAELALQNDPLMLQARVQLCNLYKKKENFEAAIKLMDEALDLHPSSGEPYAQLSALFDARRDIEQAVDKARKATEAEPNNLRRLAHFCNMLRKTKDFDTVISIMNKAILEYPQWGEPYVQFSAMHEAKGDIDSAIKDAYKAIEVEPYNLARRIFLSKLLRKHRKFDLALDVMHQAVNMNNFWGEPYIQISFIHNETNEIEAAINFARKAVSIEPYNLMYSLHLCSLLLKKGDTDSAFNILRCLAKINPFFPEIFAQHSYICNVRNDFQTAVKSMEKALKYLFNNRKYKSFYENLLCSLTKVTLPLEISDNDTECKRYVIKNLMNASDEEIYNHGFLTENIKKYGVYPLKRLVNDFPSSNFTKNGLIQVPTEFASLCLNILSQHIICSLEVGCYKAFSSYFLCALLARKQYFLNYSIIDINDKIEDFDYYKNILPIKKFIPSTSYDFAKKEFDFVFIDGDHSYKGCMSNYLNVGKFSKCVAFHDIFAHEYDHLDGGTVRAWHEFTMLNDGFAIQSFSRYPYEWMGIGLGIKF